MQNQTLQPGFFPGFFDPDGRMWSSFSHDYQKYQAGLEAALKIALLTQHKMNIPSGYLLDNPFLQRIFVKNKGEQTEAKCFRALMRDLLWIGMNQSNFVEEIEDWQAVLRNWIKGEGTKRNRFVYLNCISDVHAKEIQHANDVDQFEFRMTQCLDSQWQIQLPDSCKLAIN